MSLARDRREMRKENSSFHSPVRRVVRQEGLRQGQGSLLRIQDDVAREGILAASGCAARSGQRAVLRRLDQRLQRTDHGVLHRCGRAGALGVPRALRHRAIRRGDPDVAARRRRGGRRRRADQAAARRPADDIHPLNRRHPPVFALDAVEGSREVGLPVYSVVYLIPLLHAGTYFKYEKYSVYIYVRNIEIKISIRNKLKKKNLCHFVKLFSSIFFYY